MLKNVFFLNFPNNSKIRSHMINAKKVLLKRLLMNYRPYRLGTFAPVSAVSDLPPFLLTRLRSCAVPPTISPHCLSPTLPVRYDLPLFFLHTPAF